MNRVVSLLLKKNKALNSIFCTNIKGPFNNTTCRASSYGSYRLFSSSVTSAASITTRNAAIFGFRCLPKGFPIHPTRRMCTGSSVPDENAGLKLRLCLRLSTLFAVGAGQGLIGWWMVKSGLEEPPSKHAEPRVSPYRLAADLTSAFVIYCALLWTALSVVMPAPPAESLAWVNGAAKVKRLAIPVSLLVGVTAVSGEFVAANDVGRACSSLP